MVALVGTMEARLLALGWRVVGERKVRVGAKSLPERRWLLECVVCLARVCRGPRWVDGGSRYMTCSHPAVDDETPWEADLPCRLLVERFGAMTLEEVGEALGVTRERVRQIEAKALSRLRRRLEADGMDAEDVREFLAELAAGTDRVASATEHMSEKGGGGGQYDRRAAMTKWIDPDELAERVRERAEAAAQVDAALALARAPREDDDEPATLAGEERAMTTAKTFTHDGVTDTIRGWADRVGVNPATLRTRLSQGWPLERALSSEDGRANKAKPSEKPKRSRSQARRIEASVDAVNDAGSLGAIGPRALLELAGYTVQEVKTPAGAALFVVGGAA